MMKDLTLDSLFEIIKTNLSSAGSFAVLLPYHRTHILKTWRMKINFILQEKLLIRQTPSHNYFQ